MSAAIPKQADCCTPCDSSAPGGGTPIPGPQGPAGTNGANGADGINSFTTLTGNFTVPAVGLTQVANVVNSQWAVIGQIVALNGGGNGFQVTAKPSAIQVTLQNLGYPSNQIAGTVVPLGNQLGPGGEQGDTGAAPPATTLNSISPTTTRGDLMVDNGANSPNASVVRVGVGTDGQVLAANSGQPTGVLWTTVLPNAATDNAIVRFNGAAGFPVPGQTSSMAITDDGALQSSPTGGNARGAKAVDLQVERANATEVASGANSVIGGGKENTASAANAAVLGGEQNVASAADASVAGGGGNAASGASSFVGGGDTNTASNTHASVVAGTTNIASAVRSFIGGGKDNTASGDESAICAGRGNLASASDSTIGGGLNNIAAGIYSAIPGGTDANADKHGQLCHSAGAFATQGDCQASFLHWRIATTDATANVEMFLDGAALRAAIPSGASWGFHILLVGRSDAGVDALWETKGLVKNNAGTTSLTGSVTQTVLADGTGATWGVSGNVVVDADNANDALRIRVTGAALTNIRWHAHARIVELSY